MLRTALCDMLGIKHPIIQAGMGPFQTNNLAIAVANAGALGILSTSGLILRKAGLDLGPLAPERGDPKEVIKKWIRETREATKKQGGVFGVNIMVSAEIKDQAKEFIEAAIEGWDDSDVRKGFKVIITSAGDPVPWAEMIRSSGLKWFHVVPTVRHAKRAEKAGVDAVIASGHEGGGHIAWVPVHTMVLLPAVVNAVEVPVIGAGGFCDGATLVAALALGAAGVQMGTRFIATKEADDCFAPIWKSRILKTAESDTVVARGFVGPLRYLKTEMSSRLADATVKKIPKLYLGQPDVSLDPDLLQLEIKGHLNLLGDNEEEALFYGGEVAGRIRDVPTVGELIERIVGEAEEIIKSMPEKYLV